MKEKIERYHPTIEVGLNEKQIYQRKLEKLVNFNTNVSTKSIKSIIVGNFFTIFNLINVLLALAVFSVGEYKNMLFIGLVIINTAISTIQEVHSKKIIDKLSLISNAKVKCIRNGKKEKIAIDEIVLDDILQFETGNQVITDCILLQGEVEVNEAFITGEADPIVKKVGDLILSGSFIVSRNMYCAGRTCGRREFYIQNYKRDKIHKKNKIGDYDFFE